VILHREFADRQDAANFGIGLAQGHPGHDLALALAQRGQVRHMPLVLAVHARSLALRRWRHLAQCRVDVGQQQLERGRGACGRRRMAAERRENPFATALAVADAVHDGRAHGGDGICPIPFRSAAVQQLAEGTDLQLARHLLGRHPAVAQVTQ
jgi:hypothetical protein